MVQSTCSTELDPWETLLIIHWDSPIAFSLPGQEGDNLSLNPPTSVAGLIRLEVHIVDARLA